MAGVADRVLKRALDVTVAAGALAASWPLLLAIAVWIRTDSEGSPLFLQQRVGLDGKLFWLLKFRTMNPDAGVVVGEGGRVKNEANDPRHTKAGRVLRAWSLDELPQLINVLRGDMSLVGPRPDLEAALELDGGAHRGRLQVKPGITGNAQIGGRNALTPDEKWAMDAAYAEGWSFRGDVALLLQTALKVAAREGIYDDADPDER